MKTKYLIYAVLLFGLAALIVNRITINSSIAAGPQKGKGSSDPQTVSGVIVTPETFANSLSVSGSIEGNEQVDIRSQVSGVVTSIHFTEGSQISKGQILLKIDDAELSAQLEQAQTREALAAESERRSRLLLEKEAISREEYDVAQADYKALKAQTELIRAQLAKTTIRAPFSGKIGLRSVSEGQFISNETVIAKLVNVNPVKITFAVPEKYSNQVITNTDLTFTISGSAKKYKATVYAMDPAVDATTRTLQLRARANNSKAELIPGTFANVDLPLVSIKNALLVPTEAVVPVQNGKKVFILENGKAKEVLIETTSRTDRDLLVTSGLKAGDTVLTTGVMGLKNGTPVRVKISTNQ